MFSAHEWDPEFEPGVEEIVDYRWYNIIMAIPSVSFLWRACTLGGFPYSVTDMAALAGRGHIRVNWLTLRTPILCNTEHAQFVDVSKVDDVQ